MTSPGNTLNRRDFIKSSSLGATALLIGIGLLDSKIANASEARRITFEPNVFLQITSDGRIVLYSKNPEIGQGVKTSMPQIIAEELEVDWKQIEVVQADLDGRFGAQFAGGSGAIKSNFDTLRKAGASAREMLIEAAARKWNVSLDRCYAKNGSIFFKDSTSKFTYAELAEPASKLAIRENPILKSPKDFTIIGKSVPGVDNHFIVTGKAEFGIDAKPKDMLVAMIERCPVFGGKVKSFNDSDVLKVDGVVRVIRIDASTNPTQLVAGVAVVAKNTWAAMKGRKALRVEWDLENATLESDESLRTQFEQNINTEAEAIRHDGNTAEAFSRCRKIHEAIFEAPFLAHACMEPMNYIADVRSDGTELWGPTQVPGSVRFRAAEITGLPPDKIKVRMTRVGGGFGRRLMADYACEAIFLSKALAKPVQVLWSREDDLQHDFYRPAGMYKLKAGLDENNNLIAWELNASTTSRYQFALSTNPPFGTEIFPDAFPAGFVPNFRMQYVPLTSKVPRGAWRAPGHNVTAWIDQTFIDEMAELAGKDPVTFRLELLGKEDKVMPYRDHGGPTYDTARLKNVIDEAAKRSNWFTPASKGMFRGFAAHFMFGAYVAEVVTISLRAPGAIKVENVLAVVDCGIVINPSGALNQIQGGIIDGLSAALYQAVHIENGKVKERNFNDYKLLRMKDAPSIDVHIIESTASPEGLGEMSLPPVAAALCNAIYSATGKRVRKLPVDLSDKKSS